MSIITPVPAMPIPHLALSFFFSFASVCLFLVPFFAQTQTREERKTKAKERKKKPQKRQFRNSKSPPEKTVFAPRQKRLDALQQQTAAALAQAQPASLLYVIPLAQHIAPYNSHSCTKWATFANAAFYPQPLPTVEQP